MMIATLSGEQDNILESIGTCRFAQRVASIKNHAEVNEELDPKLLIKRLKSQIQVSHEFPLLYIRGVMYGSHDYGVLIFYSSTLLGQQFIYYTPC